MHNMEEIEILLDKLSEMVKPVVKAIEALPETTKGHYEEYIVAIGRISSMMSEDTKPAKFLAIGVALRRAGASSFGVHAALRILGYL